MGAAGHERYDSTGLSAAVHDLHARLGSIHIAVTAVSELDLDADTRSQMLSTAAEEAVRASAELAGIGSLSASLLDGADRQVCDIGALVHDAVEVARLSGLDATGDTGLPAPVLVAEGCARRALAALLRIAAGPRGAVNAGVHTTNDTVRVRMSGDAAEHAPALAKHMIEALGARWEPAPGAGEITFSMELAR